MKKAKEQGLKTLVTFGGAYSNHISALSYAGKMQVLIPLGSFEERNWAVTVNNTVNNPTLKFAYDNGMRFKFVSREAYREKENLIL